jgi:hypothetical protein
LPSDEGNFGARRLQAEPTKEGKIMKRTQTAKAVVLGGAVAGLLAGTTMRAHAMQNTSGSQQLNAGQFADDSTPDKHGCKGQNSCKGQGGCKSSDNGCKGKNTCKGKGGCATDGSKS